MVGAICSSLSYLVASPFMALWQTFGDKTGNHRRSLAEVESPYFIFGGAVGFRQAPVLAHVLGPGFDQGVAPRRPLREASSGHQRSETTHSEPRFRALLTEEASKLTLV
jgi:hypothetical protein